MNSSEARQLMDMLVDGDIRPEDVGRLADYLAEHPDLVPELRADLRLSERLSQTLCGARTAEAFAAMMETRISAEESVDKFTSDTMGRIAERGAQGVIPSVWRRWLAPLAAAASLAIVAGVWWLSQRPDTSLELRVAEVRGAGFRGQEAGGRGQVAGVTASPSNPIAKAGEDGKGSIQQATAKIEHPTPNIQHPTPKSGRGQRELRVGDILRPGDGVEVGADGYVKLAYLDGTQIDLHGSTRLRVTLGAGDGKDAKRLALDGGLLVCSVAPQKKPFLLETAHAVAEVVGTRFSLSENRDQTTLAVKDGRVDLHQNDQRLDVSAGETAVADAAGMRKLSPADAWIRELLVRAEAGPWDMVNLGTGVYSQDVWRMDARGGAAERRVWNMPVESGEASVVELGEARCPVRGVIACRLMIRTVGQPAPEVDGAQAVTNGAWRTSRVRAADLASRWRDSRRGCLRLDYNLSGTDRYWLGDVLEADAQLSGAWHRFVVYVDTEMPAGMPFVFAVWPDGSVPSAASAWVADFDKGTVTGTVKIGLMAKGVLMEVQGLKFVPLGADMPLPPKELMER